MIVSQGIEKAIKVSGKLKSAGKIHLSEKEMNELDYYFMHDKSLKEAIETLKLNAAEHSKSANAYDSLAEAYMLDGNRESAVKNYQKSASIGLLKNKLKSDAGEA